MILILHYIIWDLQIFKLKMIWIKKNFKRNSNKKNNKMLFQVYLTIHIRKILKKKFINQIKKDQWNKKVHLKKSIMKKISCNNHKLEMKMMNSLPMKIVKNKNPYNLKLKKKNKVNTHLKRKFWKKVNSLNQW